MRQSAGPLQERASQLTTRVRDRAVELQGQAQQALGQVKERAQRTLNQAGAQGHSSTTPSQGGMTG